jgi:hypothetical protein
MIAEKLDRARRDLLDLGLRNSLLNYRPLKTRGVEVVDERPALLLDLMVRHQKTMTFLHGREDGKEQETPPPESAEDAGQPDEGEEPFARHVDPRARSSKSRE